jgi:N6-adenosine-specific RNA methylase IME4
MSAYRGVIPPGEYGTIVADPPWPTEIRKDGSLSLPGKSAGGAPVKMKWGFDLMSMQEIRDMGDLVRAHSAPGAHLWLWCSIYWFVNGEALSVADAWGFRPVTVLTWDKGKLGLGRWLRVRTEHVLWCVKPGGSTLTMPRRWETLFTAPATGHSIKPDAFFAYPEALSPAPRLELFARKARPGWENVIADAPAVEPDPEGPESHDEVAGDSIEGAGDSPQEETR